MEGELRRSHVFSRSITLAKEGVPPPPRVPHHVRLSKEMEDQVKETLGKGLVDFDAIEAPHVSGAKQKAKALLSLYHPSETKGEIEEMPLQSIFSSKPMATAMKSLATMERELTTLEKELEILTAKLSPLTKELAPIEKNLGVLGRAIREEKSKEVIKDPKKPANLRAIQYLEETMGRLKTQSESLKEEVKFLEERRKSIEKQREQKEGEIFVHRELIKLREKWDLLSEAIREEEMHPKEDSHKLKYLQEKRETLDREGLGFIFTQVALRMMLQQDKSLSQEQEKISFSQITVEAIKKKRTAIRSAMEKFAEEREKRRRVMRAFSLIKEKFTPEEMESLILKSRSVVTGQTFFTDRIVLLERLAALPSKTRNRLMREAQHFITQDMSGVNRARVGKSFAKFQKAEHGEQFSRDFTLNLEGDTGDTPPTSKFILNAANAWREGRKKFRDSFSRIRSLQLQDSQEFLEQFLGLSENTREKFLNLFSSAPSREESDILFALTKIRDYSTLRESDLDPIEEIAKFKGQDPKGYKSELQGIIKYYKENPKTFLKLALEEKKKSIRGALRQAIAKRLLEDSLRMAIEKVVEKDPSIKTMRKARLRKIQASKTFDVSSLRTKLDRDLARQTEGLTNERFGEELKKMTDEEKKIKEGRLEKEIDRQLTEELENVHLLRMHPLLATFDSELLEDDVFQEGENVSAVRKQLAPPASPASPYDSGNESGSTDA